MQFSVESLDICSWIQWSTLSFLCELRNSNGVRVAECEAQFNSKNSDCYITMVFVPKPFRGNGYCELLLLNVMYYFNQLRKTKKEVRFRLFVYKDNTTAIRVYRKIFGKPFKQTLNSYWFST